MSGLAQLNDWVAVSANWLGIISLAVSTYAAVTISRIRRDIVGRVTLPAIISALEDGNGQLSAMLKDFDASHRSFEVTLSVCEANLRTIVSSRSQATPRAKSLIGDIAAFRKGRLSSGAQATALDIDRAWAIYGSLSGLVEELKRITHLHQVGG